MKDFNEIYAQYHTMVIGAISKKMNSNEDAEELTQDVFMKIYDNLHKFDEEKSALSTWIMSITNHAVIDKWRKVSLQTSSISDMVNEEGRETFQISFGSTPLTEIVSSENKETIKEVILYLPQIYKRTANMFYNLQMSYEEIADRMNCSTGTVKGRLNRARNLMKKPLSSLRS